MAALVAQDSRVILHQWYGQLRLHGAIVLAILTIIGVLGYRLDGGWGEFTLTCRGTGGDHQTVLVHGDAVLTTLLQQRGDPNVTVRPADPGSTAPWLLPSTSHTSLASDSSRATRPTRGLVANSASSTFPAMPLTRRIARPVSATPPRQAM